ncbi:MULTISPECIES: hypothetical protein [unclassified Geobacillus]|uniref:hypothetical protein n=1 Tax=unclassified Geobacillus TaxID=2642459 RepID=UPI000D394AEE|nr:MULTISPECIES: hypothetical protein [unclassified Geobacillus]PUF85791.1 hypothetical protein DCC82_15635 [Geobacillus sp. LYN3]TXK89041.1 hypothetical protein FVE68_01485 [Geobacillus sp. AYS3]
MQKLPNAYDFAKLEEAISFYTRTVAEVMKNRDRSMHEEVMRFKRELHERIDREYDPAAL